MILQSIWTLRACGLAGMLGALLFIWGDLSYNYLPGSPASPAIRMSRLPARRLLRAGLLGLAGTWLYALAALGQFLAFVPLGQAFALGLLLAFGAVLISYGIAHTAYFAIAAGAQAAAQAKGDPETGARLGNALFARLVAITYLPAVLSSLLMLYGVLSGRSLYPRWMVIFLPGLLYLLKPLASRLSHLRVGALINDCYDNLVLWIFFTLSTLVLWNRAAW